MSIILLFRTHSLYFFLLLLRHIISEGIAIVNNIRKTIEEKLKIKKVNCLNCRFNPKLRTIECLDFNKNV